MDLVARLPWWAGVALAIVLHVVLHRVAAQPVAAAVQPGQVGAFVVQTFSRTLATFGQDVLPLLCLAGAGMSAWRRHERTTLVQNITHSGSADALNEMTWQEFGQLVGEAFRRRGYAVTSPRR